nr:MAG TPA: hypothetical protein [Caudoviricetes sp.]
MCMRNTFNFYQKYKSLILFLFFVFKLLILRKK